MIHLSDKELMIIKSILSNYPYQFYVFGSRVTGKQKKYSDLDLCYKEAIPDAIISKIREAFEESNLPFKVDLLSWDRCDSEFRKNIEKDLIKMEDV